MEVETLLWASALVIEVLVVAAVVLVVLLRRSQQARRQLLAHGAKGQPVAEAARVAAVTPVAEPAAAEPAVAIEIAASDDSDKDVAVESAERLRQRMDVTNESLQRLEVGLQQDPTGASAAQFAALKGNLQDMHAEIDSLQQSSAKLRQDMTVMRDKLKHSEVDMQKLQREKEQLAAEYTALSMEYERVYANSAK